MDNYSNILQSEDYIINQNDDQIKILKQGFDGNQWKIKDNSTTYETNNSNNIEKQQQNLPVAQQIRNILRTEIGQVLEDNIRGTLQYEFNFTDSLLERDIHYRIIEYKNKAIIVKKRGKASVVRRKAIYFQYEQRLFTFGNR